MLSFLSGLFSGIFGFFTSFLPDSPFATWATGATSINLGVAYLNWFIPVGDLVVIFTAYVALLAVWFAVKFIMSKTQDIVFRQV